MENAEKPVGQLLTDLPRVSESISHVALRLEAVTADLPQTSSQFQQTLQQLNRLIVTQQEQIQSTLESLRSVTGNIRRRFFSARLHLDRRSSADEKAGWCCVHLDGRMLSVRRLCQH
jgi:ABC-type transporter Mla subunit MlaD